MLDAVQHAYGSEYANVHRGLHYLSNTATAKFEEARETVRRFLNAPAIDEIIFTRNATEAINLVASSYGAMAIDEGDEIVLSIMEHHSNIVPWHFHRERKGAVLKWAPISDSGEFLLDEFEKLLTPRTKMVALTHMSNVLGTVVPMKEVIASRMRRGIPVLVDGSQAACTYRWTWPISTAISTCSPATRPMGRRASACCTPRRRASTPCRPTWVAGR